MKSIQGTADIEFIQRLTQKFEKRFLVFAVDGLQNTASLHEPRTYNYVIVCTPAGPVYDLNK